MGNICKHQRVKLITGFIFKEEHIFKKARSALEKKFGKTDFESNTLSFRHTNYYEREFGRGLRRAFISFGKLIPPEGIPRIKIITNQIERRLSDGAYRLINIDPGYLDMGKLILASTKDYKHRIYLNKGIYAEVTLFYQGKTFCAWDWTYPDYKTSEYISILNYIRGIYARQLKDK